MATPVTPELKRISCGSGFPWPPKPSAKAGSREKLAVQPCGTLINGLIIIKTLSENPS
jgi:hypothetical protein